MSRALDEWEKDPFFGAAEQVQDSADRMEYAYRTWIQAMKDTSGFWNIEELSRDVKTALGTTKWQLDEFEKAVRASYKKSSGDDSIARHNEFVTAMKSQISRVESSLNESADSVGKSPGPWVRLDEGECTELALFLSGPASSVAQAPALLHVKDKDTLGQQSEGDQLPPGCSKISGHRRTASASPDIGSLKISVEDVFQPNSNSQTEQPLRKVPSVSGFLNTMDSMSKKWTKNGYRKLRLTDEADTKLPESQRLTRGIDACHEKSRSCLDSSDDCYDKQLYGWYGAFQRQLQRSQYYMQYSRPVQMVSWIFGIISLIVLVTVHVM